jgi:hypothetical protein
VKKRIPTSRPERGANAYYVAPESTKKEIGWAEDPAVVQFVDGKKVRVDVGRVSQPSPAEVRRSRGDAYREASALLKANRPEKSRKRRRRKGKAADVDRLSPEPGRTAASGATKMQVPIRKVPSELLEPRRQKLEGPAVSSSRGRRGTTERERADAEWQAMEAQRISDAKREAMKARAEARRGAQ